MDPWTLIALMSAAWRELDYEAPSTLRILSLVPARGRGALLPNRVSRWRLCPRQRGRGSTDELVLALSEATPVLQEGLGAPTTPALRLGRHQRYRAFPNR
ncbi:MAG: hypothetical protein ACLS3M_10520 [Collinsella sp.]